MVGGDATQLGRKFGAAGRQQLVGVNSQPKPEIPRRIEDSGGLRRVEDSLFAEDVTEAREPLFGDRGELLADDLIDVLRRSLGPVAKLGRDRMSAQIRRHQLNRALAVEQTDQLEDAHLGRDVQPVA